MEIICHRGFWRKKSEQNTIDSFLLAIDHGFGIEVDVRDHNAELVISHDYATKDSPRLIELLREVNGTQNMIALNIKSDGIFLELKSILDNLNIQNYFCFDMSIPQQVQYQRNGLNWYSRISDQIEEKSVNQASMGIWLDAFDHDWWSKDCLLDLQKSKRLCIVSPELHGRNHKYTWHKMKSITMNSDNMICTDLPIQAKEFFND